VKILVICIMGDRKRIVSTHQSRAAAEDHVLRLNEAAAAFGYSFSYRLATDREARKLGRPRNGMAKPTTGGDRGE
jgi:hypothetical protein